MPSPRRRSSTPPRRSPGSPGSSPPSPRPGGRDVPRSSSACSAPRSSGALLAHAGEPALGLVGILLALAFSLSGPRGTRLRAAAALIGGGVVADARGGPVPPRGPPRDGSLLAAPARLLVGRVLRRRLPPPAGSSRPPSRSSSATLPGPSRAPSGASRPRRGIPPYLASLSFGVLPLGLAALFALCPRRREGRFWLGAAGIGLFVSFLPWLPGARAVYEALPFLHSVRYPVKALLLTTIAVAVLASLAVERLLLEEALPRWRSRAGLVLLVVAGLLALAGVVARARPELPRGSCSTSGTPRGPPTRGSSSPPSVGASRTRRPPLPRSSSPSASFSPEASATFAAGRSSSSRSRPKGSFTPASTSPAPRPSGSTGLHRSSPPRRASRGASSSGRARTSMPFGVASPARSRPTSVTGSPLPRSHRGGRSPAPRTPCATPGTPTPTGATRSSTASPATSSPAGSGPRG